MISDEKLERFNGGEHIPYADAMEIVKELIALRKIQALPAELPCDVTIGATTFKAGVEAIKLLKAIHRRSL